MPLYRVRRWPLIDSLLSLPLLTFPLLSRRITVAPRRRRSPSPRCRPITTSPPPIHLAARDTVLGSHAHGIYLRPLPAAPATSTPPCATRIPAHPHPAATFTPTRIATTPTSPPPTGMALRPLPRTTTIAAARHATARHSNARFCARHNFPGSTANPDAAAFLGHSTTPRLAASFASARHNSLRNTPPHPPHSDPAPHPPSRPEPPRYFRSTPPPPDTTTPDAPLTTEAPPSPGSPASSFPSLPTSARGIVFAALNHPTPRHPGKPHTTHVQNQTPYLALSRQAPTATDTAPLTQPRHPSRRALHPRCRHPHPAHRKGREGGGGGVADGTEILKQARASFPKEIQ
ncbi:hypothetical protein ATK36_5028 [Amycolatopsis sulphurea]|uniref:Uncharacterized protein n=1 Tax=Amycolatopsis sulphurea TaxID=76022 RepID=A0A2A9FGZ0_9PSEU|nr:hypothetical protein ATK36_5028 [Amycolatopsis sulphurea]